MTQVKLAIVREEFVTEVSDVKILTVKEKIF